MEYNEGIEEVVVDHSVLVKNVAMIGEYPYEELVETIQTQFEDYITIEDTTNCVDILFTQLKNSYEYYELNEKEEYPEDYKQSLDNIYENFIALMQRLFGLRLLISIPMLDNDNIYHPSVEVIIRKLYEFFILNARENFAYVITKELLKKTSSTITLDAFYDMLDDYSPFIKTISAEDFLKLAGDSEIVTMFDDNSFTGNFLRKYTPKLYQNHDLCVDIVSRINTERKMLEELEGGTTNE